MEQLYPFLELNPSLMLPPPVLPLARGQAKSKNSSRLLVGRRTLPKLVSSIVRKGPQQWIYSPPGLSKPLCGFFYFHNKKNSKPNQACEYNHIGKWEKIPANNQAKILTHCHSLKGKKVWLDAEMFTKHRATVPDKFSYLLGDAKGAKST
jgi:hypothetical protein